MMLCRNHIYKVAILILLTLTGYGQQGVNPVGTHPQDSHRFLYKGDILDIAGYYPDLGTFTNFQTGGWGYIAPEIDVWNFYKEYLDNMLPYHLNYIRVVGTFHQAHFHDADPTKYNNTIYPYKRTGPGTAPDGKPKFDLNQWNDDFFNLWKNFLDYAYQRNIIVQFCIFDGAHLRSYESASTCWDFFNGSHNMNGINYDSYSWYSNQPVIKGLQEKYLRKMVDEFGQYPNIIWEVINENLRTPSWDLPMANYITQYEQQKGMNTHLVMPRDLPYHQHLNHELKPAYQIHNTFVNNFYRNQPLISDNDCCVDPGAPDYRRQRAWAALTGGGYMNYFHDEARVKSILYHADTKNAMKWVGYTRKFLVDEQINTVGMTPSDQLVTNNSWCLAKPGDRYIIYLQNGSYTDVSGLNISTLGDYCAKWYNPKTGASQQAQPGTINAGAVKYIAPSLDEWVLIIKNCPRIDLQAKFISNPVLISSCNQTIQPVFTFQHQGPSFLSSFNIHYRVDQMPVITQTVTLPLVQPAPATFTYTLPSSIIPPGTHRLTVYTSLPNGVTDINTANDTASMVFTITNGGKSLPFSENFDAISAIPDNWTLSSDMPDTNWFITNAAGYSGNHSIAFANKTVPLSQAGKRSYFYLPGVDLSKDTNAFLSFRFAHATQPGIILNDGLEVTISNDCGKTFHSIYSVGGTSMNTASPTSNTYIPKNYSEWKKVVVDLKSYTGNNDIIIQFINITGANNSILIDDILVTSRLVDVEALGFTAPSKETCIDSLQPVFKIRNNGPGGLGYIILHYQLDNYPVISDTLGDVSNTGVKSGIILHLSLSKKQSLLPGTHTIKAFLSSPNGYEDLNTLNDTVYYTFEVKKQGQTLPYSESFEGLTKDSLPAGWSLINKNEDGHKWFTTTLASYDDSTSLAFNNYSYSGTTMERDEVILPGLNLSSADSNTFFLFQYAHASRPNAIKYDSLEVAVSIDCGATYSTIWSKGGTSLNTAANNGNIFIPHHPSEWQQALISLKDFAGTEYLQLKLINWSAGGNSTLIDYLHVRNLSNVIDSSQTGIENDEASRWSVFPNPVRDNIQITYPNEQNDTQLLIWSPVGELVYQDHTNREDISLIHFPPGIYLVEMITPKAAYRKRIIKM